MHRMCIVDESLTRPLRQSVIQTRDLLLQSPYVFSFTDRVTVSNLQVFVIPSTLFHSFFGDS